MGYNDTTAVSIDDIDQSEQKSYISIDQSIINKTSVANSSGDGDSGEGINRTLL